MTFKKPFDYERPSSLEQLKDIIIKGPDTDPCYLAGGTDLLVAIGTGKSSPTQLIDLKGLPGMGGIKSLQGGRLWIGALTTIHNLASDGIVQKRATALYEGAHNLGSWQVRNRGTIGGNLANGAPTADTATPLLALDAEILTWSPWEERRIPARAFWLGAGKTDLKKGELIRGVEIPHKDNYSSAFSKLGPREAMDIAIASATVVLKCDQGIIQGVSIALGGAGPTPIRAHSAEEFLTGRPASTENFREAGILAAKDSNPRTSKRATREYRLSVIPVLVERSMQSALQRQEDLQQEKGGKD